MSPEERKQTRAAIANSVRRAESLSPDDRMADRAVIRREKRARAIIDAWEGKLAWADRIILLSAEVLNACEADFVR